MEYREARKYIYVWWRKLRKRRPLLWFTLSFGLLLLEDWFLDETRKQIATSSDALWKLLHMVALNLSFLTLLLVPPVVGWIVWKAWAEARQEIDARKTLWLLRDEGVQLRNEGITVHGFAEWDHRFKYWHRRILSVAETVDTELAYKLRTLNQWRRWNLGVPVHDEHRLRLEMISEILNRIENWMDAHPED